MSVIESVTEDLRTRILQGELFPGQALGEVEIAARYDIARPTAKRAIENLVRERLLVRHAHQSARVVRLTADEASDIYRSREVIERAAVRHLAQCRTVPPTAIAAHAEIEALFAAAPREIVAPDLRFHSALVAELGSRRLRGMYESLVSEVTLCMTQVQDAALLPTELIISEHSDLLALIAAGDEEGAISLLAQHIGRARDRLAIKLTDTASTDLQRWARTSVS